MAIAIEVEPTRSTNSAPISRSSPPRRCPSRSAASRHVLAHLTPEQVPDPLALAQPLGHPVEAGLQLADLAAVVHRHARVQLAALDPLERPRAPTVTGSAIALAANSVASSPAPMRHDAQEEDRRRHVLGVDVGLGQAGDADHEHADSGTPVPSAQAVTSRAAHAGRDRASGGRAASAQRGDRPQDVLGDQVVERAGGLPADQIVPATTAANPHECSNPLSSENSTPATSQRDGVQLDRVAGQAQRCAVLALVGLASLLHPRERAVEVPAAVPGQQTTPPTRRRRGSAARSGAPARRARRGRGRSGSGSRSPGRSRPRPRLRRSSRAT